MARGNNRNKRQNSRTHNIKKASKFRGNRNSVHKSKNRKSDKRNVDHFEKHNLEENIKRQKIEERTADVSSSESEEEIENPLKQLLHSFDSKIGKKKTIAIESEESDSSEVDTEDEIGVNNEQSHEDMANESENTENNSDVTGYDEQVFNFGNDLDEEIRIEQELFQEDDDLTLNETDPFVNHVCYDLSDDFIDALQNDCKSNVQNLEWPVLGKLLITIPKFEAVPKKKTNFTISEDKKYAPLGKIPIKLDIKNINYAEVCIKNQIIHNLKPANKALSEADTDIFTLLQSEVFSIVNNYQDLYFNERTFENGEELRFIYSLHTVNHVLKTRTKILNHNASLRKKTEDVIPEEFRDQGLVRPKVLIIVPFRDAALRIVQMLIDILVPDEKGQVINKLRFMEDFSGGELILPKKNPKPEDYEKTFSGNCDDTFKIGIQVTKKSLKLYADFYSSDIIIASPLGLRLTVGAEGETERDYDFLASIELLILDQTELFLMQNWDHLIHVLNHVHMQPKESHGTDFSRIRTWTLNGWSKYYRQTLIFSSFALAEINSIFNKKCFNYTGAVKTINPVISGAILNVHVQLPQVYRKFFAESVSECINARFDYFINKVLPQYKDSIMKQCLIYIPNYFDYVRIRNYFKREDISFVQICEYSKDSKVARARDIFYHGDTHFMLYSERFHYFRRMRIKGIRHIIFYQPPIFPHFYSEMCNFMQEANQNKKCGSLSNMTATTIYSKYDAQQIVGIVGTDRITRMATSMKNFHMFTSSDS